MFKRLALSVAVSLSLIGGTIYHAPAKSAPDVLDITEQVCYKVNKEWRAKRTTTYFDAVIDRIPDRETRANLAYACYFYKQGFTEGYKV